MVLKQRSFVLNGHFRQMVNVAIIFKSKSNKNADSYLPHGNTILVAPPGGQSVMDINAD